MPPRVQEVLAYELWGNAAWRWAVAVLVLVLGTVILRLLEAGLRRWLEKRAASRGPGWLLLSTGLVRRTKLWFLAVLALGATALVVTLPPERVAVLRVVVAVAFLLQVGLWATALVTHGVVELLVARGAQPEEAANKTGRAVIRIVALTLVWASVLLLLLDNVGVDVTALVAGLGVGGIAVALAVQNILGDLFASVSILLDKPFVAGDFIIVGDVLGTVESIGIKTTRLRSLSGEQIIMGNGDLLSSRVRNYKRMQERRVLFKVGVTYQTSAEQLERIPGVLREVVETQERTRFDRAHFQSYGDFALVFETVYYVLASDYNVYMDIQQTINMEIYRRFEQMGIEFAYPTQTLYLKREPAL